MPHDGCRAGKIQEHSEELIVYPKHMERNLFAQKGLMLSENVMMHLANRLRRMTAHGIVYKGAMEAYEKEIPFKDVLLRTPEVACSLYGRRNRRNARSA